MLYSLTSEFDESLAIAQIQTSKDRANSKQSEVQEAEGRDCIPNSTVVPVVTSPAVQNVITETTLNRAFLKAVSVNSLCPCKAHPMTASRASRARLQKEHPQALLSSAGSRTGCKTNIPYW